MSSARLRLAFALSVALLGCERETATLDDCLRILDRVVALEMKEAGYRDPALLARKQAEFRARYAAELERCVGARLSPRAMECVVTAKGNEALSHECLR